MLEFYGKLVADEAFMIKLYAKYFSHNEQSFMIAHIGNCNISTS